MNIERSRQQRALEKAKQVLLDAEREQTESRVSHLVYEFLSGQTEILKQDEFADNVGQHLYRMYKDGEREEVFKLIPILGNCAIDADPDLRERAIKALSQLSGLISSSNDLEVIVVVFEPIVAWMEYEQNYINGFGVACSQLHKIALKLLENKKYWPETESLLVNLHQIQSGLVEKSSTIRGMAAKLQESLAVKDVLEDLTKCYLTEKAEIKNIAETLLTHLGRRSVVFLLNRLMHSENKEERLQLIRLIPGAGNVVVPVLVECLKKRPPWYVVRNVIFIISELNNTSLYNLVQPYLVHRDVRVQQQVLSCIAKISGNKLKIRLIEALSRVHDELKMQIIMQLGQMAGEDVAVALLDLLDSRSTFNEETYIELLVKICVAFKFSPSKDVIGALNDLIEERKGHAGPADPVIIAARDTLLVLEPRYRHEAQSSNAEQERMGSDIDFHSVQNKTNSIRKLEQSIKELIAQGDLEKAGKKLFANAVTAARDKDFNSAELLRDKLLEINPLALSEVIRLGEIIEEEKGSSITNHHIAVWSELYEKMTTEEFNALYYAMQLGNYQVDETIVKSGETDPSLYFVNSGLVRLTCRCGGTETFLKRLHPGEVIGVNQFFSVSVWTVSMVAQSEAQVHTLSREKFKELLIEHPALESKLQDFCVKYDTVPELLKMSGSDRREFPRYSVSVVMDNTLLDPYGNTGKRSFRGEMVDISEGGLCFSIHISSRENASLLLGRQIVSEINLGGGDILKCFGVIVGVKFHGLVLQEFSVHVKLYQKLDRTKVRQVLNLEI